MKTSGFLVAAALVGALNDTSRLTIVATVARACEAGGSYQSEEDPWPEWQRTRSRLGRSVHEGPRTGTIAWNVRVDPRSGDGVLYAASPTIDREGRVFVGHTQGVTAVDAENREIAWQFLNFFDVDSAPSVFDGHVLFGSTDDLFYCLDAASGALIWSEPAEPHPNRGNVVSADGIVYYPSQLAHLYARLVADGSEIWTYEHYDGFNAAPSLDAHGALFVGGRDAREWVAFDRETASILWTFALGDIPAGTAAVEDDRLYTTAISPRMLHCVDTATGELLWSFDTDTTASGGVAIRDDGTILVLVSGGSGALIAVSPEGEELWRYPFEAQSVNAPPIADRDGTAYFCSFAGNTDGWVHAVDSDGAGLWTTQMPHMVAASPALAPDGTLYVVCRDKHLYAFKDPPGVIEPAGRHTPREPIERP